MPHSGLPNREQNVPKRYQKRRRALEDALRGVKSHIRALEAPPEGVKTHICEFTPLRASSKARPTPSNTPKIDDFFQSPGGIVLGAEILQSPRALEENAAQFVGLDKRSSKNAQISLTAVCKYRAKCAQPVSKTKAGIGGCPQRGKIAHPGFGGSPRRGKIAHLRIYPPQGILQSPTHPLKHPQNRRFPPMPKGNSTRIGCQTVIQTR